MCLDLIVFPALLCHWLQSAVARLNSQPVCESYRKHCLLESQNIAAHLDQYKLLNKRAHSTVFMHFFLHYLSSYLCCLFACKIKIKALVECCKSQRQKLNNLGQCDQIPVMLSF